MKKVLNKEGTREGEMVQKFGRWLDENRQGFTDDLVRLVNIRSVGERGEGGYPFGSGCARCLDAALEIGRRFGLRTENHEYYCGSVILDGESAEEIGIVGHLDIVPEGNGWNYPPYEATVIDGYVIGRGSADNKGAVMTALYTLKFLRDMGLRPKRTVRVLMGCNEETGMEDVIYYREHYTPPVFSLCCDTAFPFHYGEKGRYVAKLCAPVNTDEIIELSGGEAVGNIADEAHIVLRGEAAEKALCYTFSQEIQVETASCGSVTITARGRAGHTAFPEGTVNAIQKLAQAVTDASVLSGKNRDVIAFLADAFRDYYGEGLGIAFEDEPSGKLTHAGAMLRMADGNMVQSLNVRYPVTMPDAGEIRQRLAEVCREAGFSIEDESDHPPFYIPLDMPVLKLLDSTCREYLEMDGDQPFIMRGGTHCGAFPNTVGYGPFIQATSKREVKKRFGGAHGPDEAVLLDDLYDPICVYAVTLLRLDEVPTEHFAFEKRREPSAKR